MPDRGDTGALRSRRRPARLHVGTTITLHAGRHGL